MHTASKRRGPGPTRTIELALITVLAGVASACSAAPVATPVTSVAVPGPPAATPLPEPPTEVAGDGTRATIGTDLGDVEFELFTASAPVATENFINLAEAEYYRGSPFHRIIPGFMIQGGTSPTTEAGGPGYTIQDEPFAGEYVRGMVAMARTPQPDSQSSQFFILVADAPHLEGGGYTIFGRVTSGMEVVDEIVSGPRGGPQDDEALEPVLITDVSVVRP